MTPRKKLYLTLISNVALLSSISALITLFADNSSTYWQIGCNDTLTIMSIRINTPAKYTGLLTLIAIINWSKVIVDNVAMPILNFTIYNPDKKHITELSQYELHLFGNAIYMIVNLRRLLLTIVTVSQIDIALWSILSSQFTLAYTIYTLLNEKSFNHTPVHLNSYDAGYTSITIRHSN